MSGVYESLKLRFQDTLQRGKTPLVRVKSSSALSLNGEMEELERIVAARLGKIKAAVKEGEAVVADEAEQTNQLVESLKVRIAVLAAKAKETEETIKRNDFSRQQVEESLTAKNQDLQNDAKKKAEALEARGKEINDLKSTIDGKVKQIDELESGIEKAKQEAANVAKRAEDLAESSQAKATALESQLNETKDLARQKDSTIEGIEQKLVAKIKEFESVVRDKEKVLAWREAEITDLKTQLQVLKKGIGEMSSFFRQAEVLPGITGQDVSTVVLDGDANGQEEQPLNAPSEVAEVTPVVADASPEIVSPDLFQRITRELAEVTGVMSALASVIVSQQVAALGESMEKFPKTRLPELLENLAKEISDERQQSAFRGRLARNTQVSLN
jgi:DNA repair exonuclease SbcCD ATPase subunit